MKKRFLLLLIICLISSFSLINLKLSLSQEKNQFLNFYDVTVEVRDLYKNSLSQNLVKTQKEDWKLLYSLYGGNIYSITLDPKNSKIVYIGANLSIYKSTDGGETWIEKITPKHNFKCIEIDPNNSNIIFAGTL